MKSHKTKKGIIYRIFNSGADDKVFNIIDSSGSKIPILAKGAKKPTSRKSSSIESGNFVEVKIVEGYSIPIASEIKILNNFKSWKQDFAKMTYLQLLCEIIDNFAYEESSEFKLFLELKSLLEYSGDSINLAVASFLLKTLEITGNLPDINEMNQTGAIGNIYDNSTGVVNDFPSEIPTRIHKTQKYILKNNLNNCVRINLTTEERNKMLKLHVNWIERTIDKQLKSTKVLYNLI